MLEEIIDRRRAPAAVVTWTFLGVCALVTLPSAIDPDLYRYLGGYKPLTSSWQRLTLPFQHGFRGFPGILHLGLNALLLASVGVFTERLLGSARFLLLTVAAMGAYAVAHLCPLVDGHGASGVIWAYAPVVLVALRHQKKKIRDTDPLDPTLHRLTVILGIMWGIVTMVMTGLVYVMGYRGNPVFALMLGNIFHISGTGTGVVFAWIWRNRIRIRLDRPLSAP